MGGLLMTMLVIPEYYAACVTWWVIWLIRTCQPEFDSCVSCWMTSSCFTVI